MSMLRVGLLAGGIFFIFVLGGASCSCGGYQYSKIGATSRFSGYGRLGRSIGRSLDRKYTRNAYMGFGAGGLFSLIGIAMIGGSFFVKKKKEPE